MDLNQIKKQLTFIIPYIISGSILINLYLTLGNPEIFIGKKNIYSQSILPISSIIILITTSLLIFRKHPKLHLQNPLQIALLSFIIITTISTLIFTPQNTIWVASSLGLFFCLTQINLQTLTISLAQLLISITLLSLLQFIFQTDLGLQFLNEPNLLQTIKGISKIWSPFHSTPQIRSYGIFPHPNILASFTTLIIILNQNYKPNLFNHLNLFTSFSISNNLSYFTYQLLNKNKRYIQISLILLTAILIYRFPFNNITNILERFSQHQETITTLITQNKPWQIQPIHNIYLYSLTQLHFIHTISLIILNIFLFKKDKATTILLNILFLSDHYFLTNPNSFYLLIIFIYTISTETWQNNQPKNHPPALASYPQAE